MSATASAEKIGAVRRAFGWTLLVIGGLFVLLVFVPDKHPRPDALEGRITVLVMSLVVLLGPGFLLLRAGRRARKEAMRLERLVGLARVMRWVSPADLARELELPEAAAIEFLERAIARQQIDLVYVPDEQRYASRADLAQRVAIPAGRCPSCDAPHGARQLLPGERTACAFCGGALLPGGATARSG